MERELLVQTQRRVLPADQPEKRFGCPSTGMAITDTICRACRRAAPEDCINCLIPLADTGEEPAKG